MFAFDIETTGLDPHESRVTSAAIYGDGVSVVVEKADEERLLRNIAYAFYDIDPGLIVTWNGAVFDFPFLDHRYRLHGMTPFFTMVPNPAIVPKYEPVPGYLGGYDIEVRTDVGTHYHRDIAYRYRSWAEANKVTWSLKPVVRAHGIDMIEVDREHMDRLSVAERMAYNLSDVVGTFELARKEAQPAAA